MTPQRAREIWETRSPFGQLSMSEREAVEVKKVWSGMPDWACFADALVKIANGNTGG